MGRVDSFLNNNTMISWAEILLRLVLAAIFGGAIGLERERKDWAAGMRTHMMVSMGSSLIMLVSSFGFQDILGESHAELDPSRVAAIDHPTRLRIQFIQLS